MPEENNGERDALYESFKQLQIFVYFLEKILGATTRQKVSIDALLEHFNKLAPNSVISLRKLVEKWMEQTSALLDESRNYSIAITLIQTKELMDEMKSKLIAMGDPRVREAKK